MKKSGGLIWEKEQHAHKMLVVEDYIKYVRDAKYSKYYAPLIWLGDLVLCILVILKIPYTEIDWVAYMEQLDQVLVQGEYKYTNIEGSTGPLVYPAGHVRIFSFLYGLTDSGSDIRKAQYIFAGLYLATLAIVLAIYVRARVPPYVLPFLVLTKRLHSIYLLRLFNDCFTTFFAVAAILVLTFRPTLTKLSLSVLLFSLAVSVKMSALLYLPGAAVVYLHSLKSVWACFAVLSVPFLAPQVVTALPFLIEDHQAYFSKAFEFSRQFFYKWTVNWRFVSEETFLSPAFATGLLILHVSLLAYFALFPGRRWLANIQEQSLLQFLKNSLSSGIAQPTPLNSLQVVRIIALSNLVGILCARSLHYQFYSWFYWSIPLLLHTSSLPILVKPIVWLATEWSWNVFPSTTISSFLLILTLSTIIITNSNR